MVFTTKKLIQIASLSAAFAVILGAFAAHGLQNLIEAKQISTFQTGVRYHFYHTFALFIIAILIHIQPHRLLSRAALFFILGILCFSGSLYLLACREVLGIVSWTWLGPITPIGGTFFIIGWILVFLANFKK